MYCKRLVVESLNPICKGLLHQLLPQVRVELPCWYGYPPHSHFHLNRQTKNRMGAITPSQTKANVSLAVNMSATF